MTELQVVRDWYSYNSFARRRYLEKLSELPPTEPVRDRGASYPTLLELFKHSLDGVASFVQRMSALHPGENRAFLCPEPATLSDLRS